MQPNLLIILTFLTFVSSFSAQAQEIWRESFSTPEKGVWGDENSDSVLTDFENITSWSLDYSEVSLSNEDDYAKTVSTSGGRFECKDINGAVTLYSEEIDISTYKNVQVQLIAGETGSGVNQETKYITAYGIVDGVTEIIFGMNSGNWGVDTVSLSNLDGKKLQIVVRMRNDYASDKVYIDEVVVSGEEKNPVIIEPGDVVLNEVLFNPVTGGEDYVEIYNASQKQIPLNKLLLASRDNELQLTQIYPLTSEKISLKAESFLALTKDTNGVFPWYTIECPECFLQMEKFPSYNNDDDYVVLLNNDMEIIDELAYNEKMHLPVFHDREGVSLERISFYEATNNPDNWLSASEPAGFGTPGYRNSQANIELPEKVTVTFEPEAFSPNGDGYNDKYRISIQTDQPGYLCTVKIFDSSGNPVLTLAQNTLLGTNDEITWNGSNQNGHREKVGVYIVWVELYDLRGNVKHYKDGVVLTDVFN